jgi:hypothetical protein
MRAHARPRRPGKELAVLRTDPSPISGLQVAPAHTLMPATVQEVLLRFRLDLHNALEQAMFLGATHAELYAAAEAELYAACIRLGRKRMRPAGLRRAGRDIAPFAFKINENRDRDTAKRFSVLGSWFSVLGS